MEVCDRYNSLDEHGNLKSTINEQSATLAVKVDYGDSKFNEDKKSKFRVPLMTVPIFKCPKYSSSELKLAIIKLLGGCQRCGGI